MRRHSGESPAAEKPKPTATADRSSGLDQDQVQIRVNVEGDRATITLTNAYFSGRYGKLHALREDGEWGIARRKARPG